MEEKFNVKDLQRCFLEPRAVEARISSVPPAPTTDSGTERHWVRDVFVNSLMELNVGKIHIFKYIHRVFELGAS